MTYDTASSAIATIDNSQPALDVGIGGSASSLCACGSGLLSDQCCAMDRQGALPKPVQPPAETLSALYQSRRGPIEDATALCLQLLSQTPTLLPALHLLFLIRRDQGNAEAAFVLARRLVRLAPRDPGMACEFTRLLMVRGRWVEAERQARHAVRLAPDQTDTNELLARVFLERKDFVAAEFQFRRALQVAGGRKRPLLIQLAQTLLQQGALDAARSVAQEALDLQPDDVAALLQMSHIEEYGGNGGAAAALLARAAELSGNAAPIREARARLAFSLGDTDDALALLADDGTGAPALGVAALGVTALLLKGRMLDRLGRHQDAFDAFTAAQKIDYTESEITGQQTWLENTAAHYKKFFTRSLMQSLPRASREDGRPQPIFIAGFARSGTTMVEQTLSMHSRITAGGEIHSLRQVVRGAQRTLHSALPYPNALTELWMGDQRRGLDALRDAYLNDAMQQHGIAESDTAWFTDKMIFNEMHLPLIALIMPQAPVIHMIRHPLDVVLSVFSHQLSSGIRSRGDLASIARHYATMIDLVEHYRAEDATGRYLVVRYEDVVRDQRTQITRMLEFIGEPFEEDCLSFQNNTRYARTLSFTQVRRKLNEDGVFRYRNYRNQLAPIYPILQGCIERLGYAIE